MPMAMELRADGLHVDGYVNVPGRESRPVMTPRGRVNELIEPRAFAGALEEATDVQMLLDHDRNRVLASRSAGTLDIKEDAVGLRAKSVVTDPEVIQAAKEGKLKGWSFNIKNPEDTVEERADKLPLRRIRKLAMDEISLILHKVPVYSATVVEVRAEGEDEVEYRGMEDTPVFTDLTPPPMDPEPPKPEVPDYQSRINAVKL